MSDIKKKARNSAIKNGDKERHKKKRQERVTWEEKARKSDINRESESEWHKKRTRKREGEKEWQKEIERKNDIKREGEKEWHKKRKWETLA